MDRGTDQPTMRALLARADLRLTLATPERDLDASALDRPLRWVHSTDLVDPTPFLSEGLVLLTTGTQFVAAPDDAAVYDDYVRRLGDRGVAALGFGTEVVRDGIPPLLLAACVRERMPLFEVPYRTPFIAVARANAEAIAAGAYARRSWALAAQRAVSLAALRPDGLSATLAELARQLDAWVGLFDPSGALRREHPSGTLDPGTREALDAEVGAVLRRGARAGSSLRIGATPFSLQTLGRGGHLRGVIAIAGGALDAEGRAVVTSVIALAGLALEQNDGVARARSLLRGGVVHALLAGDVVLARRFGRELWGGLPAAPVVVGIADAASPALDAAAEWLEGRAAEPEGSVMFGRGPDGLVFALAEPAAPLAAELAERFGARIGLSSAVAYAAFGQGHDEARSALRRGGGAVSRFGDVAASGILGALDTDLARLVAAAALAPLVKYDHDHGTELVATARAWLANDARLDATATALGVHRHTVRARIALVERTLATDLSVFPARAELWAALQVAGSDQGPPRHGPTGGSAGLG
ncbi:PucR family transcriptional regulator [Microbacterium sp. P06]|uniref:PucR family transcriptional regulator n=1 Tax=unclassified Microbacterium TaxID=2609290 RepID=UPI0037466B4D